MTDRQDAVPRAQQTLSEDQLWTRMSLRFSELRDLVTWMRLEAKDEAVGKPSGRNNRKGRPQWHDQAPRAFDPEIGKSVRAWDLIPYIHALDQDEIRKLIQVAADLVPSLERHFSERIPSPRFLFEWGRFAAAAGAIQFVYHHETNVGRAREEQTGRAASLHPQYRWFARYVLRELPTCSTLKEAKERVQSLVDAITDGAVALPPGFGFQWFEAFLNLERKSAPNFNKLTKRMAELPLDRIRELASQPIHDLPPLDIPIPTPRG